MHGPFTDEWTENMQVASCKSAHCIFAYMCSNAIGSIREFDGISENNNNNNNK